MANTVRNSGRFATLASVCCVMVLAMSCSSGRDVTLREALFTLDQTDEIIPISPPMHRRHRNLSIHINILESWTAMPPYNQIEMADGRVATVRVMLVADSGETYKASIYTRTGGRGRGRMCRDARLDAIVPSSAAIVDVRLSSDVSIRCSDVAWYAFNGL
jgi:hypothetical protein